MTRVTGLSGLWIVVLIVLVPRWLAAGPAPGMQIQVGFESVHEPVVIRGAELPVVLGKPANTLSVVSAKEGGIAYIPHQLDARDDKDTYVLPMSADEESAVAEMPVDSNDELVFMPNDGDRRMTALQRQSLDVLAEIELTQKNGASSRWAYLITRENHESEPGVDYVHYDREDDVISGDVYRLGFSRKQPFVVEELRWALGDGSWSDNLVDSMKLRHSGKLFGLLDFRRTHGDYESTLTGVKDGPVRLIRRTENKVRIILGLKSPRVIMDYIASRGAFQMDVVVDIPFKIGLFFDEVVTVPSIDWNDDPALPTMQVRHVSLESSQVIDGEMTRDELALNESPVTAIEVSSDYGTIAMDMAMRGESPVRARAFYRDQTAMEDMPERIPGQFGNTGFHTENWEELNTDVEHMMFTARLYPAKHSGSGELESTKLRKQTHATD